MKSGLNWCKLTGQTVSVRRAQSGVRSPLQSTLPCSKHGGPHVKNLKAEGISEVRLCSLALPEWSEKEKKCRKKWKLIKNIQENEFKENEINQMQK